jgi:hypothetical protein
MVDFLLSPIELYHLMGCAGAPLIIDVARKKTTTQPTFLSLVGDGPTLQRLRANAYPAQLCHRLANLQSLRANTDDACLRLDLARPASRSCTWAPFVLLCRTPVRSAGVITTLATCAALALVWSWLV